MAHCASALMLKNKMNKRDNMTTLVFNITRNKGISLGIRQHQ